MAGAPLIALGLAAVMLTTRPAAHALSRWHERRADRYALALTGGGDAFVAAMAKLGRQNLAEPAPSRLVRWLFYSHPPLAERIELARRSG